MAEPISIQQLKNASLDVKSLEEVVNGDENVVVTTRLGEKYPSIKSVLENTITKFGFVTIDSFELGATITQRNQVLRQSSTNRLYRWTGNLPKTVEPSTLPSSDAKWLEVSDVTLKQDLASDTGYRKVANQMAANAYASPAKLEDVSFDKTDNYQVADFFDGFFWGMKGSKIAKSVDGTSWEIVGNSPTAVVGRIIKTADGEVICSSGDRVYKSNGWGTESLSWRVVLTNPSSSVDAPILRWGVDGRDSKFIVTHYGAGDSNFEKSNYVWISTDSGDTWTEVWDTSQETGGNSSESHLHAACYDYWTDRFYFTEGHGSIVGIYYSDDDGENWTRVEKDKGLNPAFTVMIPTDFGIVCGTDSADHGVYVIRRTSNEAFLEVERLGKHPNINAVDGVIGFADRGYRDEDTGIVYIGFRTNFATVNPVIFACGSGGANVALTMPTDTQGTNITRFYNLVVGNGVMLGNILGHTELTGTFSAKVSKFSAPTEAYGRDYGNMLPHDDTYTTASSIRAGSMSRAGGIRSIAIGHRAIAGLNPSSQHLLTVGHDATSGNNGNTTLGNQSKTFGQYSTAVGFQAEAVAVNATSLGKKARATALYSTAIGCDSEANNNYATALGNTAVSSTYGVAIGSGSNAFSAGVAIGNSAKTLKTSSVAVGVDAESGGSFSVSLGATVKTTADYSTSIGYKASGGASSVSIGSNSTANSGGSIAVGSASSADFVNSVAVGVEAVSGGSFSMSLGASAKTTSDYSTSIGYKANSGASCVSIGSNSTSNSSGSIAIGQAASADFANSVAIGNTATVSQNTCVAIGNNAKSLHVDSVAIGAGTQTVRSSSVSVGNRDIESVKNGGAIYLKSPNGTTHKITVGDDGTLTATTV